MTATDAIAERLAVVVPLYNEAAHLAGTLELIVQTLDSLGLPYRLLLVDDGSTDGTWELVKARCLASQDVRGIRLSRNFGKEAALAAGLESAEGAAVIVMDGDLQHPPALIPAMVEAWRAGAEVVEAVKVEPHGSNWSRPAASAFNRLFSALSGHGLQGASDFKLMDRRVLAAWRAMGERSLFFRGMNAWLGFRRVQLPFEVPTRAGGASGWSHWQLARLATTAITSFSSAPLYLVTLAGLAFSVFAVLLGAQTLVLKFTGRAVDGFTTVILLLLTIGAVVMLALGVIGAYIARIYEEVKGRPRYVIAETTR